MEVYGAGWRWVHGLLVPQKRKCLKQGIKEARKHSMSPVEIASSLVGFPCEIKCFAIAITFHFYFSTVNLNTLETIVSLFLFCCCYRRVWLIWDLLVWQIVMPRFWNSVCVSATCHLLQKQTVLADLSEHVKSCSLNNKNVSSPLAQCLRTPNLAEWWLTTWGFHP